MPALYTFFHEWWQVSPLFGVTWKIAAVLFFKNQVIKQTRKISIMDQNAIDLVERTVSGLKLYRDFITKEEEEAIIEVSSH